MEGVGDRTKLCAPGQAPSWSLRRDGGRAASRKAPTR
jgi:hypothetical protein